MSREIKFRVWNNKNKEWDYETVSRICGAVYFDDTSDLNLPSSSLDDSFPKIFCQFTGLKDKDFKEIYNGDILDNERTGENRIVKWKDDCAGFNIDEWFSRDCKIIGNIWKNPELLKEPTP